MNLAKLIGLVIGIVLIAYASILSAAGAGLSLIALWDLVSLLIVVGGALAATAIAFKMGEVLSLIKSMKMIFADDPYFWRDLEEKGPHAYVVSQHDGDVKLCSGVEGKVLGETGFVLCQLDKFQFNLLK